METEANLFGARKQSIIWKRNIGLLCFEAETDMILRGQPFCEKVSSHHMPQRRHHLRRNPYGDTPKRMVSILVLLLRPWLYHIPDNAAP